jgi:intein/homing endonuclease
MKDCVKITTESGKSIIVSKDHVFPCKNNGNVKRISVNTGLMVSDILSVVLGKM